MSAEITFTLGTLAAEFSMSRDILRRMLSEAGVAPVAKRGGRPVYRLRDAFAAVQRQADAESLTPHARLALAKAVIAEDEIRVRRRDLIPRIAVEQEQARILRIIALMLDTLPDVLERDCGLAAAVVARIEKVLDRVRDELALALVADGDDEHA